VSTEAEEKDVPEELCSDMITLAHSPYSRERAERLTKRMGANKNTINPIATIFKTLMYMIHNNPKINHHK